jgi:hypothetical protein
VVEMASVPDDLGTEGRAMRVSRWRHSTKHEPPEQRAASARPTSHGRRLLRHTQRIDAGRHRGSTPDFRWSRTTPLARGGGCGEASGGPDDPQHDMQIGYERRTRPAKGTPVRAEAGIVRVIRHASVAQETVFGPSSVSSLVSLEEAAPGSSGEDRTDAGTCSATCCHGMHGVVLACGC